MVFNKTLRFVFFLTLLPCCTISVAAQDVTPDSIVATVGDTTIKTSDYVAALRQGVRKRFYHGTPPQDEMEAFGRETLEQLIEQALLLQEAARIGLTPDKQSVDDKFNKFAQRYADNPTWQKNQEEITSDLRQRLVDGSLLEKLDAHIKQAPPPTEQEVRHYYEKNTEKFTTPEKIRVAVILLSVDPSASATTWAETRSKGQEILAQLRSGSDFAQLARKHSGDPSAEQGGDMGYLHQGMLATKAQDAIKKLQPGELTGAIQLLEGVAIFRLTERSSPTLNAFKAVQQRATELLLRELKEAARLEVIEGLRNSSKIEINTALFKKLMTPIEASQGNAAAPEK